jgi:hypothetical protein
MAIADEVICLLEGRSRLSGRPSELDRGDVESAYFGASATLGGR